LSANCPGTFWEGIFLEIYFFLKLPEYPAAEPAAKIILQNGIKNCDNEPIYLTDGTV
jgi:hypothetical protein